MIRALELLKVIDMTIDLKKIKKYEIDLARGVFKSNGREDHMDMMDALSNIDRIGLKVQHVNRRAILSRLVVETASKSFHLSVSPSSVLTGGIWSVLHGYNL